MNNIFAMVVMIYDVAIVSIKGSDHRIRFWHMSKDGGKNIVFDYI